MARCAALFVFALLLSHVAAMMWGISLVPSGPRYMLKRTRHLKNKARICPRKYKHGFSFVCHGNMKGPVRMYMNGKLRRVVWRPPYTMRPIVRNWIYSVHWLPYGKWVSVTCKSRWGKRGASYHGVFYIGCGKAKIRGRGRPRKPRVHRPKPKPRHKPRKEMNLTWRKGCVTIRALYPLRKGSNLRGWTRTKIGGITYRAGDKWEGVEKEGTSPLKYQFWVPRKSRYAVTLDMRTTHWTEHNDVFLRFNHGRGLSGSRNYKRKRLGRWFLKAYHNENGRALQAFHVDYNAHSMFTTDVLVPGKRYEIVVGARSTQTTIYAIHLFPCKGWSCDYASAAYKRRLKQCHRIWK